MAVNHGVAEAERYLWEDVTGTVDDVCIYGVRSAAEGLADSAQHDLNSDQENRWPILADASIEEASDMMEEALWDFLDDLARDGG